MFRLWKRRVAAIIPGAYPPVVSTTPMRYISHLRAPADLRNEIEDMQRRFPGVREKDAFSVPHVTLAVGLYREELEEEMLAALARVRSGVLRVTLGAPAAFDHGALVLRVEESPELRAQHAAVIEALRPFLDRNARTPLAPEYEDRRETYERYGSPYVGPYWHPHLTFTYVGEEHVEEALAQAAHLTGRSFLAEEHFFTKYTTPRTTIGTFPLDTPDAETRNPNP